MIAINIGIPTDSVDITLAKSNSNNWLLGEGFEFELSKAILSGEVKTESITSYEDVSRGNTLVLNAPEVDFVTELAYIINPAIENLSFSANSTFNGDSSQISSEKNISLFNTEIESNSQNEEESTSQQVLVNNLNIKITSEQNNEVSIPSLNLKNGESVVRLLNLGPYVGEPDSQVNIPKPFSYTNTQNSSTQNETSSYSQNNLTVGESEVQSNHEDKKVRSSIKLTDAPKTTVSEVNLNVSIPETDKTVINTIKISQTNAASNIDILNENTNYANRNNQSFPKELTKNLARSNQGISSDVGYILPDAEKSKLILSKPEISPNSLIRENFEQEENFALLELLAKKISPKSQYLLHDKWQNNASNTGYNLETAKLAHNSKEQNNLPGSTDKNETHKPNTEHNRIIDAKAIFNEAHKQNTSGDATMRIGDDNSPKGKLKDGSSRHSDSNFMGESKEQPRVFSAENDKTDNQNTVKPTQTPLKHGAVVAKVAGHQTEMVVNNVKAENTQTALYEFSRVQLREVPRKIMQLATATPAGSTQSAKLIMYPKSLGTIIVQITIADSVVKLNLKGDSMESLMMLESTSVLLKDRFQTKGLILDKIEYELNTTGNETYLSKENQNGREKTNMGKLMTRYDSSHDDETQTKDEQPKTRLRYDNGKIIEKYI